MNTQHPLSERDICTKFITPALKRAGWDIDTQLLEEVSFTDGRIIVRGKLVARVSAKEPIIFFTTNPFLLLLLKPKISHILFAQVFSKRWIMPGF